jgi:hypothetical protein
MIKKDKLFELKIEEDDDISGIDSISLVDEPAIEINWMYFNKVKPQEFHIPDNEDDKYLEKLKAIAQDEQELLDEGWVVSKVTPMGKQGFITAPDPNAPSVENEKEYRVRYKYVLNPAAGTNPVIDTTRDFCRELVQKNYVWRLEDLDALTNDEGDSALVWRGGYNCRHLWARIEYNYDDTIRNKAGVNQGKIDPQAPLDTRVLGMEQPDTRVPEWPSFSKQGFEGGKITIECKECGHKWDMEDGGKEPYMCGKCGYDNSYDMGYDVSTIGGYQDPGVKKKKKKGQKFVQDEEKRIIIGPAMVPDLRIPRRTKNGEMYEVFFSAPTIKLIMEKYMKNQYTRNNDLNHDGTAVKDVYVVESWIKEDGEDKSNKYGYGDLPMGTWFVAMKVAKTPEGDKVWEMVKNGELAGYSVSGWFEEVAQFCREEMFLKQVVEILKRY